MMILYKLATIKSRGYKGCSTNELVGQVIVAISMLAVEKQPASNYDKRLTIMRMAAEAASKALGSFTGARRRFELIGKVQGCYIIDDYAHHPTEVRAVLQGARQRFRQQPIWVIFQPHTFR
jgi:UDP-N-acetylmuramoylalanine-D-glutamate ligase